MAHTIGAVITRYRSPTVFTLTGTDLSRSSYLVLLLEAAATYDILLIIHSGKKLLIGGVGT